MAVISKFHIDSLVFLGHCHTFAIKVYICYIRILRYQNTTITDQNLLLFYNMKLHSVFKVSNNFEMEL